MPKNAPDFVLENSTPYHKSIKWKIQCNYYNNRGNKAWLSGEVPYQITSNNVAARQNVELVYAAIEQMEKRGVYKKGENINILEMASGLGYFAINFLKEFKSLDKVKGKGYYKFIKYYFTDFSRKNLENSATNQTLRKYKKEGKLIFAILDAIYPEQITLLDSLYNIKTPLVMAVIANYLHCCLPLKILRGIDGKLYEKFIKLTLKVKDSEQSGFQVNTPIKSEEINISDIHEIERWKSINNGFFTDVIHQQIIKEVSDSNPITSIIYPYGTFESIKSTFKIIKKGGIVLISDKGYSGPSQMRGGYSCTPTIHGNSFAHSVNFPLIEKYVSKLGFASVRTGNPRFVIQTMMIENNKNNKLKDIFNKIFINDNVNLVRNDYYRAGRRFLEDDSENLIAIRFLERAYDLSDKDAYICYYLGNAFYKYGVLNQALKVYKKGEKYNYFNDYDFATIIAEVNLKIKTLNKLVKKD